MVRELTTKRFLRGLPATVEFRHCQLANVAVGCYRLLHVKCAESLVLEPFEKLFQWCPMAFTGYARVDPNNLMYRRNTSSQKEWGAFDITGQATLGLYALFADLNIVRAPHARQRRRV
ncbi:hypothetical protein [Pseudomonas antarctica]|uniref:hypothetical protein n=1 Tax=Pseudomonas antarctica TaxID=219572 RepID=UPI003F7531E3